MKVKVEVSKLIERVKAAKERELRAFDAAVAAYPELEAEYRLRLEAALSRALAKVERGKLPPSYARYSASRGDVEGVIIDVGVRQPVKPRKPDVSRYDKRLKELRLTSSKELLVDAWSADWRGIL